MRPPRRSLPSIIHLARTVSLTRVFSLLSCYPLDLLCLYPYIPAPSSASGNYFHFRGELYITPSSSVSSSSTRDPSVSCSHDSLMLLSPRRTEHRLVSSTATVYSQVRCRSWGVSGVQLTGVQHRRSAPLSLAESSRHLVRSIHGPGQSHRIVPLGFGGYHCEDCLGISSLISLGESMQDEDVLPWQMSEVLLLSAHPTGHGMLDTSQSTIPGQHPMQALYIRFSPNLLISQICVARSCSFSHPQCNLSNHICTRNESVATCPACTLRHSRQGM